jgi:hypothetical protein
MAIEYVYRKEDNLVIEVYVGDVTKEEWFTHERSQMKDAELQPGGKVIVDLSNATMDESIGDAEIREFTELYGPYRELVAGTRVGIVAGAEFARSRVYERFAQVYGINVIVFNDVHTACTWLGVDARSAKEWIDKTRARTQAKS